MVEPLTEAETAKKAEADRVLQQGHNAAQLADNGIIEKIKQGLTDPQTGGFDVKKLALIGGVGAFATAIGSAFGIVPMTILGGGGIILSYLGADALFNALGWKIKDIAPPILPKPVGLTPTPGFNTTVAVAVPDKAKPGGNFVAAIPITDPSKNPMPEHDLAYADALRKKAESESPVNNPANQKLRDRVNELELKADQWEVNLRSTRKYFTDYNTKIYPELEKILQGPIWR